MKNSIKLFLDEDVFPELAIILRKIGYDAVSTVELKRKGKTDLEQMEFAISEKRAILTFNIKDFILIHNKYISVGKIHYGIIVSSQKSFKEILKRLLKLLNHCKAEFLINNVEFLNN